VLSAVALVCAVRFRIEELTQKLQAPQLEIDTAEDRSPSPPPIYDRDGKRTNTREQRTRQAYLLERQTLIQRATTMTPTFKPPSDYRPVNVRKNKKIYIPIDKYPEYNFIGLIIGPRGMTQKQMELDSGAKIAIRGKGSVKDGKVCSIQCNATQSNQQCSRLTMLWCCRLVQQMNSGDDDRLHVLIMADTDDAIDKASRMVEKLLVPVEEGKNEHKRQQLRKLAEINGTLRDNMWGRRDLERNFDGPQVSCAFCGDFGHPSRDCPVKSSGGAGVPRTKIDSEYENFLAEIGEGAPRPPPSRELGGGGGDRAPFDTPEIHQAYLEFMAAIGLEPSGTGISLNAGGGGGGGGGGGWDQGGAPPPWETSSSFDGF